MRNLTERCDNTIKQWNFKYENENWNINISVGHSNIHNFVPLLFPHEKSIL